jgi:small subunit ribosomal protein S14
LANPGLGAASGSSFNPELVTDTPSFLPHQRTTLSGFTPVRQRVYIVLKDKRRRILFDYFEKRRAVYKAVANNFNLPEQLRMEAFSRLALLPRDSCKCCACCRHLWQFILSLCYAAPVAAVTRYRNRCVLTQRSRAIMRKFGMSRLMFRQYAQDGQLAGVKKASW